VGTHFPFLGYDNDNKYRITFYSALSRLVFSSSEDVNNSFDAFVAPNLAIIAQLSQTADLRNAAVKLAIIGALRDLRGITSSTYNKRTYNLLFDSLYPDAFPLLVRVAETWYDDPIVMTALLKFMQVQQYIHLHVDIDSICNTYHKNVFLLELVLSVRQSTVVLRCSIHRVFLFIGLDISCYAGIRIQ
jgi:hypothetical protein